MICTVFRPKRTKGGRVAVARLYRGRFRLNGDPRVSDVPLHTSDKRVAQQRLEEIVKERQLEREGMLPPRALRIAAQSSLEKHLSEYVADLTALKRDDQYVYELKNRVLKLMRDCGWSQLKDVTVESFQNWRAKRSRSPKTLNEYLGSISSLLNWLERNERISRNPLKHVQKVQGNGTQVRPRRAFTDEEMKRLLAVAGPRKVVYLTAVFTGLRRSELAALEREDIHLEAAKPFLHARSSTTKNRKDAVIAFHPSVVGEIRILMATPPARANRIFEDRMPTIEQFKADLKAAKIEFLDAKGRRADFHSLRHTLATNLARAGTAPRVAMEVMRHSDMRLTAKTYTDAGLLPVADAVLSLPALSPDKAADSQIDSQSLFREGHTLSGVGTKAVEEACAEALRGQEDRRAVATVGTESPKKENGGQNRIRTCEGVSQQIYSLPRLATSVSAQIFPKRDALWERDANGIVFAAEVNALLRGAMGGGSRASARSGRSIEVDEVARGVGVDDHAVRGGLFEGAVAAAGADGEGGADDVDGAQADVGEGAAGALDDAFGPGDGGAFEFVQGEHGVDDLGGGQNDVGEAATDFVVKGFFLRHRDVGAKAGGGKAQEGNGAKKEEGGFRETHGHFLRFR